MKMKNKQLLLITLLLLVPKARAVTVRDLQQGSMHMANCTADAKWHLQTGNMQALGDNALFVGLVELTVLYVTYMQIVELAKSSKYISRDTEMVATLVANATILATAICICAYM